MATRAERTALIFLSAVVLAGAMVRVTRAARHGTAPEPAAAKALARQRRAVDSAAHSPNPSRGETPAREGRGVRRGRAPSALPAPHSQFPVDVDRASARELEALPRVGPALAARIVAERDAKGPFGSLDSLRARVKGIGPAMVKTLEPLVVFSSR
jgi:competence protein ComEA